MSCFMQDTINPDTGELEQAEWLDDYFGKHRYGVRFPGGKVFREEDIKSSPQPTLEQRIEQRRIEIAERDCASEQRESCELGDLCECAAKARAALSPERSCETCEFEPYVFPCTHKCELIDWRPKTSPGGM